MDELNHYLHQLPDFLRAEVTAKVGNVGHLHPTQVIDHYWAATHDLMANKRAPLQQEHIDNAKLLLGNMQSTKADMENRMLLQSFPGPVGTDFYTMTINADFQMQSIRFLNEFKTNIESLHARLKEQERQHAQRLAEDAVRRQAEAAARAQAQAQEAARLQAEAAARARAQAEETARRLAEEQAAQQRAKEAALQLAQRQVEEAARDLALRKADEKSISPEPDPTRSTELIVGPEATLQIKSAIGKLKKAIEEAIAEFSDVINAYDLSDQQFATLHSVESGR